MLAGDGLDREQAFLAIEEATRKQPVILPGSNPTSRDRQKSLAHLAPSSLSSPATDQIHLFIPILQELQFSLGDYGQPETLEASLAGIDTLLLISGNEIGERAAQHRNVITAAKRGGVARIVYTSLLRADTSPLNLALEHVQTEADIKVSGVAYTILRNGWHTENYTGSIPAAIANSAFYGSADNGRISSDARADYAEAAAVVLTTAGHTGRTYELASDSAYTLTELADEISQKSDKSIPYVNLPEREYSAALRAAGLPHDLADGLAAWDVSASQGALFDDSHQLSALIGRPTTSLADSVRAALI